MPKIHFIFPDGERKTINARNGENVKDIALDNDIDGIYGECGGSCTCATCHVHIKAPWAQKLEAADEYEQDMLEFAPDYTEDSRLSCQVSMDDTKDGLEIYVPDRQY